MPIRVAIIDDHPLAITGLVNMLKDVPGILLTDTFTHSTALLNALESVQPDVLLLDIKLPDINGEELANTISKTYPELKMIAITSFDAPAYVKMMMKAGCKGYLLKTTDIDNLILAIREVYDGGTFIEPALQQQIVNNLISFRKEDRVMPAITQREQEVLELIVAEHTNQDISDKLFISARTVERHRLSLLYKLGAKNTAGLVKSAIELGLIK